jgi:hypothetical protein
MNVDRKLIEAALDWLCTLSLNHGWPEYFSRRTDEKETLEKCKKALREILKGES